MGRKANPRAIGAFVIGAVVLVVAAILIFGSGGFFKDKLTVVMYFRGSVNGLDVGAPVKLRGVPIGKVTQIKVIVSPKRKEVLIPVFAELDPGSLKEIGTERKLTLSRITEGLDEAINVTGLRAQLILQSMLTGKLFVELEFFPDTPVNLVGMDFEHPEIPTVPSTTEEMLETFRVAAKKIAEIPLDEITDNLNTVIAQIRRIVKSPEIPATLSSIKQSADGVQTLVTNLNQQIAPVLDNANLTLEQIQNLARQLNRRLNPVLVGIEQTNDMLQTLIGRVERNVEPLANSAIGALDQANATLASVDGALTQDSPLGYEVFRTLTELAQAARSLRELANYLERHPEALLQGKSAAGER